MFARSAEVSRLATDQLHAASTTVPPEDHVGYRYPASQESDYNFAELPDIPWEDSLPKEDQGPDGIYRKPGFDFEQAVHRLSGEILEAGGPSPLGYVFLRDVDLPSRPLVTNIEAQHGELAGRTEIGEDELAVDALADIRALPLADESLGMMLCSNVTQHDLRQIRMINREKSLTADQKSIMIHREVSRAYDFALAAAESGDIDYLRHQKSPRIAAIVQAARVLEPDGLLVINGLTPNDAKIAKHLGMELVMHTPMDQVEKAYGPAYMIREAVFRKTDNEALPPGRRSSDH